MEKKEIKFTWKKYCNVCLIGKRDIFEKKNLYLNDLIFFVNFQDSTLFFGDKFHDSNVYFYFSLDFFLHLNHKTF